MEKALKAYQNEMNKFSNQLAERKAEQSRLQDEINAIKSDVKTNAKKGKLSSLLRGNDTDRLAKLLAEKQIVDIEVEALTEVANQGDDEAVAKAINYIDKAQEESERVQKEFENKRLEAEALMTQARQMLSEYSVTQQNGSIKAIFNKVRADLDGVLSCKYTEKDHSVFERGLREDLSYLKEILTRGE